jgi:hypothetical protein
MIVRIDRWRCRRPGSVRLGGWLRWDAARVQRRLAAAARDEQPPDRKRSSFVLPGCVIKQLLGHHPTDTAQPLTTMKAEAAEVEMGEEAPEAEQQQDIPSEEELR